VPVQTFRYISNLVLQLKNSVRLTHNYLRHLVATIEEAADLGTYVVHRNFSASPISQFILCPEPFSYFTGKWWRRV
jgi:hypothetical protein